MRFPTQEAPRRTLRPVLAAKLRARIAADGPMPFEQYMAACLYDPDEGFFSTGPLRSVKEGDFLTSPEVSPWFGRTLGKFIESQAASHKSHHPFLVVDVGAGSGSLLKPLMETLASPSDDLLPPPQGEVRESGPQGREGGYSFDAVEASPAARQALGRLLDPDHVHETIDDLPK